MRVCNPIGHFSGKPQTLAFQNRMENATALHKEEKNVEEWYVPAPKTAQITTKHA